MVPQIDEEVVMKMFALQNRDATEFYWSTEYGWTDIDHADFFFGNELDETYCLELLDKTKGKWVINEVKLDIAV